MLGIVSCTKHGVSRNSAYFIMRAEEPVRTYEMEGTFGFKTGEFVDYDELLGIANVTEKPELEIRDVQARIEGFARLAIKNEEYKTGNPALDAVTHRMWQKLQGAASVIIRKMLVSAPIIVRFHNDADGSSGAYSLYLSAKEFASAFSLKTNFVWLMQRGISYSTFDSDNDTLIANNYSCIEKPLLILIDFGTNTDSNGGLEEVRERFDIVWLDHHPLIPEFEGASLEDYINTWQFGGDSDYTAGLLTSVLCKTFSGVDTREQEGASLIGERSGNLRKSQIVWLDHWVAACLVPLAVWILLSGLDDLFIDLVFFLTGRRQFPWPAESELDQAPQSRIAILVPLWREYRVIAIRN